MRVLERWQSAQTDLKVLYFRQKKSTLTGIERREKK